MPAARCIRAAALRGGYEISEAIMLTKILFAVLTACGVQPNPATALDEPLAAVPIPLDHVTVERSGESTHVLGYADGAVAIEVVVWRSEGAPLLSVTLPDGSYMFTQVHGDDVTIDTDDRTKVEAQLAELGEAMDVDAETETAGWLDCGLEAVGAAGACIAVVPHWCIIGTIAAACTCLPEIVDEFEDYDCPGFG
jgi:hypothetical protein